MSLVLDQQTSQKKILAYSLLLILAYTITGKLGLMLALPPGYADAHKLEALFAGKLSINSESKVADGFRYRITRKTENDLKTIELPEEQTPAAIRDCVKDTLD